MFHPTLWKRLTLPLFLLLTLVNAQDRTLGTLVPDTFLYSETFLFMTELLAVFTTLIVACQTVMMTLHVFLSNITSIRSVRILTFIVLLSGLSGSALILLQYTTILTPSQVHCDAQIRLNVAIFSLNRVAMYLFWSYYIQLVYNFYVNNPLNAKINLVCRRIRKFIFFVYSVYFLVNMLSLRSRSIRVGDGSEQHGTHAEMCIQKSSPRASQSGVWTLGFMCDVFVVGSLLFTTINRLRAITAYIYENPFADWQHVYFQARRMTTLQTLSLFSILFARTLTAFTGFGVFLILIDVFLNCTSVFLMFDMYTHVYVSCCRKNDYRYFKCWLNLCRQLDLVACSEDYYYHEVLPATADVDRELYDTAYQFRVAIHEAQRRRSISSSDWRRRSGLELHAMGGDDRMSLGSHSTTGYYDGFRYSRNGMNTSSSSSPAGSRIGTPTSRLPPVYEDSQPSQTLTSVGDYSSTPQQSFQE